MPAVSGDARMPLNDNQRTFIARYRATTPRNATRAYEAVYKARGEAARKNASEYLTKPDIRAEIDRLDAEDLRDLGITAAAVLREIARLGFSDVRQLYDDTGALKAPHALDDDVAAAVSSVEVVSYVNEDSGEPLLTRTHKIRLWNKEGSLTLLAKHLKLISDKVELGAETLAQLARLLDRLPDTALHELVTPNGEAAPLPHRER
jgi:phage terminase small subunit